MAERRMFAKSIIDSDAFLDMSVTARLLYYDLGMRADDDGFVNSPKKIMRMVGASEDDLRILALRKFIIPFDNGVVVIKHWRIHNYIRKDTYNETNYKEQKDLLELDENNAYRLTDNSFPSTERPRIVDGPSTQDRIGKDRLGNNNIHACELLNSEDVVAAFKDFREMRKKAKKPMTELAEERLLTKLTKLSGGEPAKAVLILNQSTDHAWSDVYDLKEDKKTDHGFESRHFDYDALLRSQS